MRCCAMFHLFVGLCFSMLVTYAPPILSISHAVLPRSVVVFLDIPSHCRRIVLRCTRTHNSSLHSLRCSTCIPPLHCVLFLPCCWCCYLFLVIGRLHPLVLPLRSSFTTCFPSAHVTTGTRCSPISARFSCCCLCPPIVSPRSLHPAKGFASQAPEYILFTFPVTSL
jgi:hypothetical protein